MIKINLLPQKRAKRAAAAGTSGDSAGTKQLLLGIGGVVAAGVLVFVLFDMPKRSERSDLEASNKVMAADITAKKAKLEGYETLKQEEAAALAKIEGINRLISAKVTPANILHELGEILSVKGPTMTEQMVKLVANDPNKKLQTDWDPQHVWLESFTDTAGAFRLEGGAQSKEDVTQLSKRLAASVYFDQVTPQSGDKVSDKDSGLTYYKFLITGKVAY